MTLKTIVKGKVTGKVLKSSQPINFLGSVDKKTGAITDQKHVLFGKKIARSEEHTSELQSHLNLVCRLLLEKK